VRSFIFREAGIIIRCFKEKGTAEGGGDGGGDGAPTNFHSALKIERLRYALRKA
jgi:hypothetical protein